MRTKPIAAILSGSGLAWLGGVAVQLQQAALAPPWAYAAVITLAALALFMAVRGAEDGRGILILAALAAVLAGFGVTGLRAGARLTEVLPPAIEGQDLQVTGVIASLPQLRSSGLRFRFEVEHATLRDQPIQVPHKVALSWYTGFDKDAVLSQPQRQLRAGQRWRFTVRLRQPHGNANPHGFDYELYLFEQGVRATGYVRDAPALRLDEAAGYYVQHWRQSVRDAITSEVNDPRIAGVLAALTVGDQAAIDRDDWDLFRNTGVAHLMSISGLHVTMFAWAAGLVVSALWRRSQGAMLALPAQHAARWGGVAAALAYAVFSGWGVPSQRTVWMLTTVALLHSLGRRWPWPLVLLAAAVVVTLFDPWALLQPGFWLSFTAVGLLMGSEFAHGAAAVGAQPGVLWRIVRALRKGLRTQVVATIGLTPLTLVFFQQISTVSFVANLAAIPIVTLVVTPLALLGVALKPLWSLAAWAVQQLVEGLAWLAAWPGAVWTVPAAPWWAQLAGLLAALLLVLPLPWRLRLLALPLALPLLLPPRALPDEGQFELLAADVGQGTAVLLRTRAHLLVYDAGPQYSLDSDAGQRVLLPLLRSRGEERIDVLLLSHRDTDHVGGADTLLENKRVGQLLSSLEPEHPLLTYPVVQQRCQAGQRWRWDGVDFEVLRPQPADYERKLKPNSMSCVLRVSGGGHSVLLTGDIERAQELALVAAHGE
ncbi:MAG: DNA internalization-related competence protein ComEC/Rec2, partial [Burkholderiaceae bacterium]|nr:DNA internalization-related competence protein ComEC/Rec2 [Burkholderiaceae bacterium]